jgi:hypothetical protein
MDLCAQHDAPPTVMLLIEQSNDNAKPRRALTPCGAFQIIGRRLRPPGRSMIQQSCRVHIVTQSLVSRSIHRAPGGRIRRERNRQNRPDGVAYIRQDDATQSTAPGTRISRSLDVRSLRVDRTCPVRDSTAACDPELKWNQGRFISDDRFPKERAGQ